MDLLHYLWTDRHPMSNRIAIWILLLPYFVTAQVQLPWGETPESQGMGGVTLPLSGTYQPMGNPANLAALEGFSLGGFTTQPFGLPELTASYLRASLPARHGGIGAALSYSGFQGLRHYALHTGFGHRLWKRLDGGVNVELTFTNTPEGQIFTSASLAAGLSIPIGRSVLMGVMARNPISIPSNEAYRSDPQMAVTLSYRISELVLLVSEWNQEVREPADIRIGISYNPIKNLALRTGFQSRTSSFFAGASYRIRQNWELSIAGGYHPFLGFTPSAGFGFHVPKKQ